MTILHKLINRLKSFCVGVGVSVSTLEISTLLQCDVKKYLYNVSWEKSHGGALLLRIAIIDCCIVAFDTVLSITFNWFFWIVLLLENRISRPKSLCCLLLSSFNNANADFIQFVMSWKNTVHVRMRSQYRALAIELGCQNICSPELYPSLDRVLIEATFYFHKRIALRQDWTPEGKSRDVIISL